MITKVPPSRTWPTWCSTPPNHIEAFSPGVEKRARRFFELKNFGVYNAFSHTKLTDQLETCHSKNALSTPGLNASNIQEALGITCAEWLCRKLRCPMFAPLGVSETARFAATTLGLDSVLECQNVPENTIFSFYTAQSLRAIAKFHITSESQRLVCLATDLTLSEGPK